MLTYKSIFQGLYANLFDNYRSLTYKKIAKRFSQTENGSMGKNLWDRKPSNHPPTKDWHFASKNPKKGNADFGCVWYAIHRKMSNILLNYKLPVNIVPQLM